MAEQHGPPGARRGPRRGRPFQGDVQLDLGFGDLFKGLGNLLDLANKMAEQGKSEIDRTEEINGPGPLISSVRSISDLPCSAILLARSRRFPRPLKRSPNPRSSWTSPWNGRPRRGPRRAPGGPCCSAIVYPPQPSALHNAR